MIIRYATLSDKKAILSLLDELLDEANKKNDKSPKQTEGQQKREALFKELLKRPDVKIFVAEKGSHLLGVADLFIVPIMRRGYYQGHIEDFVVTSKLRGKGVGTAIMQEIKAYCKKNNITVIKLTSAFELEGAHRFYEKHGGVVTEKMFRFDLR